MIKSNKKSVSAAKYQAKGIKIYENARDRIAKINTNVIKGTTNKLASGDMYE